MHLEQESIFNESSDYVILVYWIKKNFFILAGEYLNHGHLQFC